MTHELLAAAQIREIAVESSTDPRSVRAVLLGKRVRGMAHDRIRRALVARGIEITSAAADQRAA